MSNLVRSSSHATFFTIFAIMAIVALALASLGVETDASHICTDTGPGPESSNGKCGAASFTIDMQNAGNTASGLPTGHTEILGTVETCVQINENGLLDADEDSIDAVFVDVTVLNIPTNPPSPHDRTGAIGFSYVIQYDALNLTITAEDPNFILLANPGISLLDVSDAVPDNNADNVWTANVLDTNSSDPEEGSGVLQRITLETEAAAATALYSIAIENLGTPAAGSAYTIDADNDPQYPDAIAGGSVAVNDTCVNLTPTPSPAPTATPTPTPTPAPTATPSPTPTPTPTPSPTPTSCSTSCPTPAPTPTPGNPIAVDTSWVGFDWILSGLPFAAQGPFTFDSPSPVIVRITDSDCKGDRFRLFDFESAVADTSSVPKGPCPDATAATNPDAAFADPTYSHGEFALGPGPHYLDIRVITNPFNAGRGFIRVDTVKTTPTPTPSPTPTLPPGFHDAAVERLEGPASVQLRSGVADTKASATTIVVRNESDHADRVGVYLAFVPPPGTSNPADCSPGGVMDLGVVTLRAGRRTTFRVDPSWLCEHSSEVDGLPWALKAFADLHADDGDSCATVAQMFSGECSAALADDDRDEGDNAKNRARPEIIALTP